MVNFKDRTSTPLCNTPFDPSLIECILIKYIVHANSQCVKYPNQLLLSMHSSIEDTAFSAYFNELFSEIQTSWLYNQEQLGRLTPGIKKLEWPSSLSNINVPILIFENELNIFILICRNTKLRVKCHLQSCLDPTLYKIMPRFGILFIYFIQDAAIWLVWFVMFSCSACAFEYSFVYFKSIYCCLALSKIHFITISWYIHANTHEFERYMYVHRSFFLKSWLIFWKIKVRHFVQKHVISRCAYLNIIFSFHI